ncbi:MAG: hypothetical protein JXR31_06600 [Prolixibacteraceae bacterium]|nr:hypothetical protein [Prolixibacteraceae bacterium]
MKIHPYNKIKTFTLIMVAAILINGCKGFFDPIENKETGEDITLLILDMNFFTTRVTYKFIDAKEGFLITSPATVTFSGKNSNDIVTFGGKKKSEFTTNVGELELTVDPNIDFSENNPFEFAVNVEIEGYSATTKGVQFRTTGIKTVEVQLLKLSDQQEEDLNGEINTEDGDTSFVFLFTPSISGLKSATADPFLYSINFTITMGSLLQLQDVSGNPIFANSQEVMDAYNADPENFIVLSRSFFTGYLPWVEVLNLTGTPDSYIYQLLETGSINGLTVGGIVVTSFGGGIITASASFTGLPAPDYFGFTQLSGAYDSIVGTDFNISYFGQQYKLAKASAEVLCPTGSEITFQSGTISSFDITADVYDRQDPPQLINTVSFSGNFPETFQPENTPPIPVTLVFRNNNPAFKPIADLVIDNFCTGSYSVTVEPQDGYEEYQIVLRAYCPDNPTVAVAPTYSGEYRRAGTSDVWQGTSMAGGVVDLLGLPNQEYEYRLLWENDWEYTTIWTEFDAGGNYIHSTDSRSITSTTLPDGRIRITVEHDFKQSVCDDMGW